MTDLASLEPVARRQWAVRKYEDYEKDPLTKSIELSVLMYKEPANSKFAETIERGKWKATVDKKVNYLLARPPVCEGHQDELDSLADFIKLTARDYYLKGSLIWIVQGDGESVDPVPMILSNAIAVYSDDNKEDRVAVIRKRIDIEIESGSGAETRVEWIDLYYGNMLESYCLTLSDRDTATKFEAEPTFIEVGKTGDAPLFSYLENYINCFEATNEHQHSATLANTEPLTEVRGYSGTDDVDLLDAVRNKKIVRVDGNGGVTQHIRSMDSSSIELWQKRLLEEYYEVACIVGKENELAYAQSGKAMDRLFVDMENSAKELGSILEKALKEYFSVIGIKDVDIIWNTDRPVNDAETIAAIQQSVGLLSKRTLLEQHPWVDNVEKEEQRISQENNEGIEDLIDDDDNNERELDIG